MPSATAALASPAEVVVAWLADEDLVGPSSEGQWKYSVSFTPDDGDDYVTVFDTRGQYDGRKQSGGRMVEHYGVQISVRSNEYPRGWRKGKELEFALTAMTKQDFTFLDQASGQEVTVTLWAFNPVSPIIKVGEEMRGRRQLFTLNGTLSLTWG